MSATVAGGTQIPQCTRRMSKPPRLRRAFFGRSVHEVAPELIGATLLFDGVGGMIVEVEAYHHTDPAAHSYRGPTARNAVMFGPPGRGLRLPLLRHPLVPEFRLRAGRLGQRRADPGAAAGRGPFRHAAAARARPRSARSARDRASSPRRCASPASTTACRSTARRSNCARASGKPEIVVGPRIGISKAVEHPWRYGLKGSPFLSKPFPS